MPVIKESTRLRPEPQADGTRHRDPLVRRGQLTAPLVPSEHDDGIRPLVCHEQPPPGRIEAEIAWPVALRGDDLIERESTGRAHREHRDAVVTAVRYVQRATRGGDVDVGRVVRSDPRSPPA